MSVPTVNELKSHAISIINSDKETFIDAAKAVYEIPETGFNEVKTSKFIDGQLRGLGFSVQTGIAKTGLKATITGKDSGPTIAVIAELDALNVPMHLGADTETGAAHACGHHAQIGILLGVAVDQDTSGQARSIALALAKGVGCTRAGVVECSFADETDVNLLGEQALWPLLTQALLLTYEVAVESMLRDLKHRN